MKNNIRKDNHQVAEFFAKFLVWGSTAYLVMIMCIIMAAKLHLL